jgi:hypothetical protein
MEQPHIAVRADAYPPSPIRKLLPYAKAAEAAGHIITLTLPMPLRKGTQTY